MKSCKLKFVSRQTEPLTLILEPWGDEVRLAQGDWVSIQLDSHLEGEPEVIFENGCILVYAWWGCLLRFEINGEPQVEYPRVPSQIPIPLPPI